MPGKKSKKLYWIIGAIVVVVGGLFMAKQNGWVGEKKKTYVQISEVKKVDITETVSASGKVQPETEVKISPDVSGEVVELLIKEGDSVVAGSLLCRIRPDNYQSMLDRAIASLNSSKASLAQTKALRMQSESRFNQSKANFERQRKLHLDKVISDADFETAKANFEVAKEDMESTKANVEAAEYSVRSGEATVKDARETLRKTSIFAPMSGIVSKLAIEKGERVVGTAQMTGTEMMRIANLSSMEVVIDVNENDITRIQLGDTAIIDVDAFSSQGKKFQGVVTSIANTAKTQLTSETVTEFEVKVRILPASYKDLIKEKKEKYPFRPGMTASVEIITDKRRQVLSVPLAAVTIRQEKDENEMKEKSDGPKVTDEKQAKKKVETSQVVFVFDGKKVKKTEVKTGISDFDNIQILSGLKPNDKVVSGPFLTVSKKLKDGMEVVEETKSKKGKKDGKSSGNDEEEDEEE